MADEGIVNYVKDNLSRGVSVDEIKNSLSAKGWTEDQINDAVAQAGAPADIQQPLVAPKEDANVPPMDSGNKKEEKVDEEGKKSNKNTILIIAIVILVILFIVLIFVGFNIFQTFNEMFPAGGDTITEALGG